jgi:hypothetical protein
MVLVQQGRRSYIEGFSQNLECCSSNNDIFQSRSLMNRDACTGGISFLHDELKVLGVELFGKVKVATNVTSLL